MRVIRDVLGLAFPLGVTRMDAYSTDAADPGYSDLPPVLLCASSDAAMARAARTVQASGLRIGAKLPIEHASERLDQQIAASASWVELDRDCGGAMDDLLNRISRDVTDGRYAAIVSASAELLDPVVAGIEDFAVELVVGAGDAERAAALATATAGRTLPLKFSDVAADNNAERLRQLSEEVSRIASTLARLSAGPGSPPRVLEPAVAGDVPPLAAEMVRNVIRARRLRARYFPEELFADPAWDMLLDLLQAEIAQLRVPVSSLCIAAAVPATTALRWLKTLVSQGVFVRRADPRDGRRVFVELAPQTSEALRRYFADVGQVAAI
jgi:predicted transcriptional regulator